RFTVGGTVALGLGSGPLTIDGDLEIDADAGTLTVRGNGIDSRVFQVNHDRTVTLAGLIITNGRTDNAVGGGIFSQGKLSLRDCTVSGNTAALGGGIYSSGPLTVDNCTIAGNTTTAPGYSGNGGGIFASFGPLTVSNTTLTGNATNYGGAL